MLKHPLTASLLTPSLAAALLLTPTTAAQAIPAPTPTGPSLLTDAHLPKAAEVPTIEAPTTPSALLPPAVGATTVALTTTLEVAVEGYREGKAHLEEQEAAHRQAEAFRRAQEAAAKAKQEKAQALKRAALKKAAAEREALRKKKAEAARQEALKKAAAKRAKAQALKKVSPSAKEGQTPLPGKRLAPSPSTKATPLKGKGGRTVYQGYPAVPSSLSPALLCQAPSGDPLMKPWVQAIRGRVIEQFDPKSVGGTRPGDPRDHGKGLALDVMTRSKTQGDEVLAWSLRNFKTLNLKYIIWRQHIYQSPTSTGKLMEDRGSITANHFDHVHLSFKEGSGVCPPFPG